VRARATSGYAAAIALVVLLYTSSSVMRQLKESTDSQLSSILKKIDRIAGH
jgi:hypothetical protein